MKLYEQPLKLKTNQIPYLIPGGHLIEQFLGEPETENPPSQMWVASVVSCVLKGSGDSRSRVICPDGSEFCLAEALEADPKDYLGEVFAAQYGATTGFLLKLLNSRDRLLVQAHPNQEKAMKYFGSRFGKTECWYVMNTEPGEDAYIWAGFRKDATKEHFLELVKCQDTEQILGCLHRFAIRPGDVIFIPAGLPHAMGSHSLVAEIQEPTDITLRAERFRPDGSELPEESLHSGIGYEGLMDCFCFDCEEAAQVHDRIFLQPKSCRTTWGEETCLVGAETTALFGMNRLHCERSCIRENRTFSVALVLGGSGWVIGGENGAVRVPVKKGSELFLPHGLKRYEYLPDGELEILECYPPKV